MNDSPVGYQTKVALKRTDQINVSGGDHLEQRQNKVTTDSVTSVLTSVPRVTTDMQSNIRANIIGDIRHLRSFHSG